MFYLPVVQFFADIIVGFMKPSFIVYEDNEPVEPMLKISRPLYCSPISMRVLVEDITTTGNYIYYNMCKSGLPDIYT